MNTDHYIDGFSKLFPSAEGKDLWHLPRNLELILSNQMTTLSDDYAISENVAIHRTANIEENVVIKGVAIIGPNVFVASFSYLRGGVYLGENVKVGPGCEIKSSVIFPDSSVAHFNFVGDSILGNRVNMEAGSVIANHFNERTDKAISVWNKRNWTDTGTTKFGALIGDDCKIGANAVLSPGTLLDPATIVGRLELVEQFK